MASGQQRFEDRKDELRKDASDAIDNGTPVNVVVDNLTQQLDAAQDVARGEVLPEVEKLTGPLPRTI